MGNTLTVCFGFRKDRRTNQWREEQRSQHWAQTGVASVQSVQWSRALPQLVQHGEQIRLLYARDSAVDKFPAQLLEHLPNLERLDLSENSLVNVPVGLLYRLKRLWSLNLARNAIRDLEQDESNRRGHDSSVVGTTNEPEDARWVSALQWLSLSDNRLERIPAVMESIAFPRLRYLNLAGNNIRSLPNWLGSVFPQLEVLVLSRNQLAAVDAESIRGLAQLRQLSLDHNQLRSLPSNLFMELRSLQRLELEGNQGLLADSPVAVLSTMVGFGAFEQRRRDVQDKRLAATAN
jgi:Leucine-rich repeat (LRR) protein